MKKLLLLALILTGCQTFQATTPTGFERAMPEQVQMVTTTIEEQFHPTQTRTDVAILACGVEGATAYFSPAFNADTPKEQRVDAAITAANRHGRLYYTDILKEQTLLQLMTRRFGLTVESSDAEKWLGILRYFIMRRGEIILLLRQWSPSSSAISSLL